MEKNNYDIQVVRELKGGELLYPRNIPGDRGSVSLALQIVIIILLWGACVFFAMKHRDLQQAAKYSWYCTTSNFLLIVVSGYIWRICNLSEELRHVHSRYDGDVGRVFASALQMNTVTIVMTVLCIASLIGMIIDVGNPLTYFWNFHPEPYVFSLIASLLITRLCNTDESRLSTCLTISNLKGLDYGSGMAYSYFYGYLNIILPAQGDEKKGLLENIELYEAQHGVKIPVKKLFILIPTSLRIPPDLKEASYNWLESVAKLESVTKTRAGTLGRTYHNTVYKIHPGGRQNGNDSIYVITEGATPLLTFYEVLEHSGRDSTSYNDFKKEIAGSFYRTLRHIIKSKPECRDLCELVFYDDLDPDQNKVNVAKVLISKIDEQKKLTL